MIAAPCQWPGGKYGTASRSRQLQLEVGLGQWDSDPVPTRTSTVGPPGSSQIIPRPLASGNFQEFVNPGPIVTVLHFRRWDLGKVQLRYCARPGDFGAPPLRA